MTSPPQQREATGSDGPSRADARRNRDRILAAAEEAFAEVGLGIPVDEVARRAGVGPGTLYRNFPTKEALFEAVLLRHLAALAAEARELVGSEHPGDALFGVLRRLSAEAAHKRNLVEAFIGAGGQFGVEITGAKQECERAMGELLVRAQEAGEIRGDVEIADLFAMVMGCALSTPGAGSAAQERMISVVCEGLRA